MADFITSPDTVSVSAKGGSGMPGQPSRMLIVDDNEMVLASLQDMFLAEGYDVSVAGDGEAALELLRESQPFDVVLLDVMLPGKTGFEVLRESHESGLLAPIMMLSARGEQESILRGFGLGAADYVTKPFNPDDLAARVRTIVGKGQRTARKTDRYAFGDVEADFRTNTLRRAGVEVALQELEMDILRYLIAHRGETVTVNRLLREALTIDLDSVTFSVDVDTMARTVEQHIASLRRKLEPNPSAPRYLETVYGLGYRFNG